jgi:P4 family phage/plasmid primase-like protien
MIDLAMIRERMKLREFSQTDTSEVSLATSLLHDIAGSGPRAIATRGGLYAYDDDTGAWSELERGDLMSLVQVYSACTVHSSRDSKPLGLSSSKCKGIIECALTSPEAVDARFFDSAKEGVAFLNGFAWVTADGVQFAEKSPAHRALSCVPFEYAPEAECQEWLAVNRRVFEGDPDAEDKRKLLQEFVGACVAGVAYRFTKCLILSGSGNNGKNVVADIIADHLFPAEAVTHTTPQSWSKPEYLSRLRSSRLNLANEIPANDIQAGDVFKAVIDGNAVTARDLYAAPYTLRPRAGHLFLANELPGTRDNTQGFWRRVLVLEFKRNFSAHPDETGQLRTKEEVKSALVGELPGIMLWALHGAVRLLKQGRYTVPESHHRALAEWRLETDQVAAFVEDACLIDGGTMSLTAIHRTFLEWCEFRRRQALNDRSLAKRLRALGIESGKNKYGAYFALTTMMQGAWGTKSNASA